MKFRENNDLEFDEETVHTIKRIHLPQNSGSFVESKGKLTDFALIELDHSVNKCSEYETRAGKCWNITPISLPSRDISIQPLKEVRTLGW